MFNPDLPDAVGSVVASKYGDATGQISEATRWLAQIGDFARQRDREVRRAWDAIDVIQKQGVMGGDWDCLTLDRTLIQTADVAEIMEMVEATVLGGIPRFVTKAATMQKEPLAEHTRTIMNADWANNWACWDAHRLAERDCVLKGQGVVVNELITDYDEADRVKKKRDKLARKLLKDPTTEAVMIHLQEQTSLYEDSTPGDEDEDDYGDTYLWDQNVRRDRVSTRYCPIESFIRDPYNERPERWTWWGESLVVELEALQNDPDLNIPRQLKPDVVTNAQEMSEGGQIKPMFMTPLTKGLIKMRPMMVARHLKLIHRIWYLDHDDDGCPIWSMAIITRGARKPLFERKNMLNPFNLLEWNERGGMNFPMSDVMKALTTILEKRDARSRIFEKMSRSAQSTLIYDKGDIPHKSDLQSVVRGVSANYVGIDNRMNKPLNQLFHEIKPTSLTQEDMGYLSMLEDSRRSATGLGNNQNLEAMKSDTSAYEAAEVARRSQMRSLFKATKVNQWLVNSARMRLQLMALYYEADDIRDIAGPEAAAWWQRQDFTPENIREMPIQIERGSMTVETDETQAQKLIQDIAMVSQNPVFAVAVQVQEMLSEVFRLQGFPDPSKFLRKLPPGTIDQLLQAQIMASMQPGGAKKGSAPAQKNRQQGANRPSDGGTNS